MLAGRGVGSPEKLAFAGDGAPIEALHDGEAGLVVARTVHAEVALVAVNSGAAPVEVVFDATGLGPLAGPWRVVAGAIAGPTTTQDGRMRWTLAAKATSIVVAAR